jgi:hypothetical protein
MRFGEHVCTFCSVLLEQTKSKTSPPRFCLIFRVLELKTRKIRGGPARKKKGGQRSAAFITRVITEAGTIRKTASVNHVLTEAVALQQPPRLMD